MRRIRIASIRSSRREVLRIGHPLRDHTIGQIAFNPNARPGDADYGMLYIGVGDGGDTVPGRRRNRRRCATRRTRACRSASSCGSTRLPAEGRKYTVPPDNPFVGRESISRRSGRTACAIRSGSPGTRAAIRKMLDRRHRSGAGRGSQRRRARRATTAGANAKAPRRRPSRPEPTSDLPSDRRDAGIHLSGRPVPARSRQGGHRLLRVSRPPYSAPPAASTSSATSRAAASSSPTPQRLVSGKQARFAEIKLKYLARQRTLLEILDNDSRADLRFGTDAAGEIYVLTKRDGMIRKLSIAER